MFQKHAHMFQFFQESYKQDNIKKNAAIFLLNITSIFQ